MGAVGRADKNLHGGVIEDRSPLRVDPTLELIEARSGTTHANNEVRCLTVESSVHDRPLRHARETARKGVVAIKDSPASTNGNLPAICSIPRSAREVYKHVIP